jgi:hypothetical protein
MGPLELTTIRQLINAHRAQAHDICNILSLILDNQDEASLSQYVLTFLQRHGFPTNLLSSHPTLLYGEMCAKSGPTLLCHLGYDNAAPAQLQAQTIATILLSLTIYQKILATRTDTSPITFKWLLSQKNAVHTLNVQNSINQQIALLQADACLWYEPLMTERMIPGNSDNLILATGTKGHLSVGLQVQTAHSPLHSSYGTIAPNAAWRLLWALNSLKDQREEILIDGFYDTMTPLEDDAFQQLADLPDTAAAQAARWGIQDLLMGLQGKQMHYTHILTPTCTINRLTSGEDVAAPLDHSIPATARAIVDFYLVPGQDPADIFNKLKRHLRVCGFADIHVTLRHAGSPTYTPTHHNFVQQVMQSAERVYEHSPIILPVLPEYVPICTFMPNPSRPVVILPIYSSESHKKGKSKVQSLYNSIAHLTSIMLCYGKTSI